MCGLTGFMLAGSDSSHPAHQLGLGGLLQHRGPDAFNNWIDPTQTVGLQHYRLAIIDLSEAGAQPMYSPCKRYVMAFNGEIYNHLALRAALEAEGCAPNWRGHSDTETLLAGISAWGLRRTLDASVGMFAIGLYDLGSQSLTLVRDRMGEKPIYYGYLSGAFCFASEPKALRRLPTSSAFRIHHGALASYMRLGYVPGAQSIYEGLLRLPAGSTLTVNRLEVDACKLPEPQFYWSALDLPTKREAYSSDSGAQQQLDGLDAVLRNTVKEQMVADVPLGVLLSGGIDSSVVASLMQAQSSRPIQTFCIGLSGNTTDEAPYARRVAAHLGTDHNELYVRPKDALDLVQSLPTVYCEPFADSSQIPTLLVAHMARRSVKVVLTGDGGDELFGGYDRYFRVSRGWSRIEHIPAVIRRTLAVGVQRIPFGLINSLARLIGNPGGLGNPADRLYKIAAAACSQNPTELNSALISLWGQEILLSKPKESGLEFLRDLPWAPTLVEQLMLADIMYYLPDDLLVKVDRASMSVGLEARAPFLDHRVAAYAWGMELGDKIVNGEAKGILKALLNRYLPRALFDRPKQGFGLPLNAWLRDGLREWAEDLLSESSLQKSGLLNVQTVRHKWIEHKSGRRNWPHHLWHVLMFQAWFDKLND